jgi:lipoprotein-anchoring transpeptidase ErfK/SrfK
LSIIGGVLLVGVSTAGATPTTTGETTTTTTVAEPTTTTTSTTTATSTTTTTTTTTTAAPPPPLIATPSPLTPTRGTQAQVTDTLPPPPTTTTTTVAPSWVLPANSGTGRRVVYSKSAMRVWTVEADGTVSKTHLVSGRRTWNQPLPGTYNVFSRSGYTCNIKNPAICWRYMVRFAKGPGGDNIGFHEIPTNTSTGRKVQSVSQLGIPLSAGCVRQSTPDAQYMWGWAPVGTKVVVLG